MHEEDKTAPRAREVAGTPAADRRGHTTEQPSGAGTDPTSVGADATGQGDEPPHPPDPTAVEEDVTALRSDQTDD